MFWRYDQHMHLAEVRLLDACQVSLVALLFGYWLLLGPCMFCKLSISLPSLHYSNKVVGCRYE